jgi:hypothetical protein
MTKTKDNNNIKNRSSRLYSLPILAVIAVAAALATTTTTTQMAYAQEGCNEEEIDTTPALVQNTESDINGETRTTERQSDDNSANAAVQVNHDREHEVDSGSAGGAAGDTTAANSWERVIDNPGKGEELIIISGESNEKSSSASTGQTASQGFCLQANQGL